MGSKRVSAVAVQALKEALASIFWYKRDLRSFLTNSLSDRRLVDAANWDDYKRQIVSDIVDHLCGDQTRYQDDLLALLQEVSQFDTFGHLKQLEDGDAKVARARRAVGELRRIVGAHSLLAAEARAVEQRRRRATGRREKNAAFRSALEALREDYVRMVADASPRRRGFDLERLLCALFALYDLDPKASFRITGEQIDGALSLEGTEYLLEAKWESEPVGADALDVLASKVRRQLDNTLGLFISISGFSPTGVSAHCRSRPVLILMTGADLMAVLDGRIDLVGLLVRKRQHAARTGGILISVQDILG